MSEKPGVHEERLEELAAYYGGDLSPAETAAFEAHLAECERCRETLRVMKSALPLAEEMLAFKPKHTIDEQVARFQAMVKEKRAREAADARIPRGRLWLALSIGAAVTAVAAYAFLRMAAEPVNTGSQVYAPPQPRLDGG